MELLLKRSSLCAAHAGRNTIMPADLHLQTLLLTLIPEEVTADTIPVGLAQTVSNIKANLLLKQQHVDANSETQSTVPPSMDMDSNTTTTATEHE